MHIPHTYRHKLNTRVPLPLPVSRPTTHPTNSPAYIYACISFIHSRRAEGGPFISDQGPKESSNVQIPSPFQEMIRLSPVRGVNRAIRSHLATLSARLARA